MRLLMRLALALYPVAWRRRYGPEIRQLIDDGRTSPADLIDLIGHAPLRSTIQEETSTMTRYLSAHPVATAVVALLALIPTGAVVTASLLKYVGGVAAPFDTIEPAMTSLIANPIGEKLLLLAPFGALALAILPFARLRLTRREGRLAGVAEIAAPYLNVVVGLVAAALIATMGVYWFAENL